MNPRIVADLNELMQKVREATSKNTPNVHTILVRKDFETLYATFMLVDFMQSVLENRK